MNTSSSTIASYLQDAQVLEGSLRRTLIAHIAVSARDEHRKLLEDHLRVTIAQEARLADRVADLGGGPNPVQTAIGAAKGVAALAITLAKGPADALRGPTGDDVALRNAQDECASEALEIAVYDALEALAEELGDEQTAELARRHRAQEEDFLERLTKQLPELARNVAQARQGNRRFPLSTVGALDAARALVTGAQTALRPGGSDGWSSEDSQDSTSSARAPKAPETAPPARAADASPAELPHLEASKAPRPVAPAKQAGAPAPPAAAKPGAKAKPGASATAPAAAGTKLQAVTSPTAKAVTPAQPKPKPKPKPAAKAPAKAKPEVAAAKAPAKPTTKGGGAKPVAAVPPPAPAAAKPEPPARKGTEPIAQYDDMTPYEIGQMLDHLPDETLTAVEDYERANEAREQVLESIAKQREA